MLGSSMTFDDQCKIPILYRLPMPNAGDLSMNQGLTRCTCRLATAARVTQGFITNFRQAIDQLDQFQFGSFHFEICEIHRSTVVPVCVLPLNSLLVHNSLPVSKRLF